MFFFFFLAIASSAEPEQLLLLLRYLRYCTGTAQVSLFLVGILPERDAAVVVFE